MGEVIPLIPPLDERRLHAALSEITGDDTTAVVLVAVSPGYVGVRTFGPSEQCQEALRSALERSCSKA